MSLEKKKMMAAQVCLDTLTTLWQTLVWLSGVLCICATKKNLLQTLVCLDPHPHCRVAETFVPLSYVVHASVCVRVSVCVCE